MQWRLSAVRDETLRFDEQGDRAVDSTNVIKLPSLAAQWTRCLGGRATMRCVISTLSPDQADVIFVGLRHVNVVDTCAVPSMFTPTLVHRKPAAHPKPCTAL